jgi:hypothetical protein
MNPPQTAPLVTEWSRRLRFGVVRALLRRLVVGFLGLGVGHQVRHRGRGIGLLAGQYVAVGVEGEGDGGVPRAARSRPSRSRRRRVGGMRAYGEDHGAEFW